MIFSNNFKINNSVIIQSKLIEDYSSRIILNKLSKTEINRFKKIQNDRRKREFITARILLKQYFDDNVILTYKNKKPFLNDHTYISISHKDEELVICINESVQIGIDIEKIDTKIKKIKTKFCNTRELFELEKNESIEMLTMLWSAKEAVFKCLDNQDDIYLKDISVTLINNEKGYGEIQGDRYLLDFKIHDGSYIVCHAQKEH